VSGSTPFAVSFKSWAFKCNSPVLSAHTLSPKHLHLHSKALAKLLHTSDSIYESHPRPKTSYSSVSVATPKGICSLTPSSSQLRSRLTLLLAKYLQFVKMTARTVLPGDSHSQRALVQPALPIMLIKQGTGRGTCESSLDQPWALRDVTVVSTPSRANPSESTKNPSNGTNKPGKFYVPHCFRAQLQLSIFQHLPFLSHSQIA
jgi:hypothetical protein